MKKIVYFCDKCGKETKEVHNGDVNKNLYKFRIDNVNNFHDIDKHGICIELCGECTALFASILKDFNEFCDKHVDTYKKKLQTSVAQVERENVA